MTSPTQDWNTALNRYVSTVRTGGTPEQRTWAWARATTALDQLIAHDNAELKRRTKRGTEELEAA